MLSSNYDGTFVIRTQVRARNAAIAFTDAQRKVVQEVIFDGVDTERERIHAIRDVGVAFGKGQQPVTTNLMNFIR